MVTERLQRQANISSDDGTDRPAASVGLAVALVSGGALGYEILLTRLLSIIQWHHYAYMVISLALLGFGASGTLLSLLGARLRHRFELHYALNASAFGVSVVASFALVQSIPFNPLELIWGGTQTLWLAFVYVTLMVPFFFAANCIGLSFIRFRGHIPWLYGADLVGAGLGCGAIVLLLFVLHPVPALQLIGCVGLGAALCAAWSHSASGWRAGLTCGLLGVVVLAFSTQWLTLSPSEYKGLSRALSATGAVVEAERSSPLGLVTTVSNEQIPFRYAPGLSLSARGTPAEQVALFSDADAMSVVTRFDGNLAPLGYLRDLPSALAYTLLDQPSVLVLGAGGGTQVLQALVHDARRVDAVELNPDIVAAVREEQGEFSGYLYDNDRVGVYIDEARGFIIHGDRRYDLVQVALLDSFSAASAGLYALSESYLYTVEAIEDFLAHLTPNGILAVTRWLKLPPRDGAKLFATVIEALERSGAAAPGDRLAWIRTWNTSTVLVKNSPWTREDTAALRRFAETRGFDLVYYPGIRAAEANRFNRLRAPIFFDTAAALLGPDRASFMDAYKFDIRPATDDRPYFFNFFKWSTFPELLAKRALGGAALLDVAYPIVVATLVQALVLGMVLIALPLLLQRRATTRTPVRKRRVLAYFLSIGFAFLLIEIAFIQKMVLLLHHPLYAVAVVLAGLLVFAGVGSMLAGRTNSHSVSRPVTWIIGLGLAYIFLFPSLFVWLAPLPEWARIVVALALLAPLGVPMGMLFPRGIAWVAARSQRLIPWVWAVNGCASVASAILAVLLAMHFGFNAVLFLALLLYASAAYFRPSTFG